MKHNNDKMTIAPTSSQPCSKPNVMCRNYFLGFVEGGGKTAVLTMVGLSFICPFRTEDCPDGLSDGFGFCAMVYYFLGFVDGGGDTKVLSIKGLSLICPSLNLSVLGLLGRTFGLFCGCFLSVIFIYYSFFNSYFCFWKTKIYFVYFV
jgi:hypothetical protein